MCKTSGICSSTFSFCSYKTIVGMVSLQQSPTPNATLRLLRCSAMGSFQWPRRSPPPGA